MDQKKIGNFISEQRKIKKLTQEQLAEKLNISKNAVSKWERGLSFPDVSLYKKLCKELDINIEELINGEKDNSVEAKEKAIISTVEAKDKVKNNYKKILMLFIFSFLIIIFMMIGYYNFNLKVNFVYDSDKLYNEVIDYIKEDEFKNNHDSKEKDFNVFCSFYEFGIEEDNEYKYVYMWVYKQSYYVEKEEYGGSLVISSGSSMPIKAVFKNNKLEEVIYPKDGSEYVSSIKEMFPGIIEYQVLNFDKPQNADKLFMEVENKKNIYYDYLNLDMNKITIDDLVYDDLIFSVETQKSNCDIPVVLSIYKDNKYKLFTEYKGCKSNTFCTSDLRYNKFIEGTYDYDVIEIIRRSVDANNHQYNSYNLPDYSIFSGKGHNFVTDNDNKYLKEFLDLIDVDLDKCAKANYED